MCMTSLWIVVILVVIGYRDVIVCARDGIRYKQLLVTIVSMFLYSLNGQGYKFKTMLIVIKYIDVFVSGCRLTDCALIVH